MFGFRQIIFEMVHIFDILFTGMLTHGVAHVEFLLSVIVPIPNNNRGNRCDSSNYRVITISRLPGTFSDIVILRTKLTCVY